MTQRLGESDLFKLMRKLTLEQSRQSGNGAVRQLIDAMLLDLTTCNSLTEQDRDTLWTMVQNGGVAKIESRKPMSNGVTKALGRVKWRGQCRGCGFMMPRYPGRYPEKCPKCDVPYMNIDSDMEWVDNGTAATVEELVTFLAILAEAESKGLSGSVLCEQAFSDSVRDFYQALSSDHIRRSLTKAAMKTFFSRDASEILTEDTSREIGRAPYFLDPVVCSIWAPILECFGVRPARNNLEIFHALVSLVDQTKPTPSRDRAIRECFRVFDVGDGLAQRLREEVAKRQALTESLRMQKRRPDKFNLLKALSSCLTRVMIEGQSNRNSKDQDGYLEVGKVVFAMMERAFAGDLNSPSRFLDLYFLDEGND